MRDWNEFKRLEEMMNRTLEQYNRMFLGRYFPPVKSLYQYSVTPYREPNVNINETDKEIIVSAEIPGVEKQDIKIDITNNILQITAEQKYEEKKDDKGYVYREIGREKYYRAVSLSSNIDVDNIKATYNNGILEIRMPKIVGSHTKTIKIE